MSVFPAPAPAPARRSDPRPQGGGPAEGARPAGRSRRSAGVTVALTIAAILALATGWALLQAPGGTRLRAAPALPGAALVPPAVTTAQLHGGVSVVHFWASWCEPCKQEAPAFARVASAARGYARVVAVNSGDEASPARGFVRHYRWRMPVLFDQSQAAERAWGVTGLPTTFVLDARGRIARRLIGPQTPGAVLAAVAEVRHGAVAGEPLREATQEL